MVAASLRALRRRCRGISAGVFAAPLGHLDAAVRDLEGWGGGMLHFDVMDGVFVPQITGGAAFVAAIGAGLVRDVHLMVERPARHVEAFARAGADLITVHAEAPDAAEALSRVRECRKRTARPILAGLAVLPETPLDLLAPLLDPAPDLVLLLSLDPRTGTPADVSHAAERLRRLAGSFGQERPVMAIDGGIDEATVAEAAAAGADVVVSGSAIFRAARPEAAFRRLHDRWATACGRGLEIRLEG